VDAGKDLHQRRLAGAVFAHQRVDFAGLQFQADFAERIDTTETLGNPACRQDRRTACAACIDLDAGIVIE
jgi:hypothetical protein